MIKFYTLLFLITVFVNLNHSSAFQYSRGTNLYGEERWQFVDLPSFYFQFNTDFSESYLKTINFKHLDVYDFKTQSDVAVHLYRVERFNESLTILRSIKQKHPDDYIVTKNLATIYELTDKTDSAFYILKEYINKHPYFEKTNLWVQMKMVEARIEIQRDPSWLFKNKVFNLNLKHATPKTKEVPITDPLYEENNSTLAAIVHHLKERLPYSPKPNLLISAALAEAGDIMAKEFSMNHAIVLYSIAGELDPSDTFQLKGKIENMRSIMDKKKTERFSYQEIKEYVAEMKQEPQIEYTDNTMFNSTTRELEQAVALQEKLEIEEAQKKVRDQPNMTERIVLGIAIFLILALILLFLRN